MKDEKKELADLGTQELTEELRKRGFFTSKVPPQNQGLLFKTNLSRFNGKETRFGVISCTHLGSRYQQMTHLHTFYALAKERHCKYVLHCGDVFDGDSHMHVGMEYELFLHGADAQLRYGIENYPDHVKTLVIAGNHDLSFYKQSGLNIVKAWADERSDVTYLGDTTTTVFSDGLKIGLQHASGGVSYARSYRLQKGIDGLSSENKPHFMFIGHYHVPAYIPQYRNVEAWQMGCFQAQSAYLATKMLYPVVGGLIVTIRPDVEGIGSILYEWVPFYKMIENDF